MGGVDCRQGSPGVGCIVIATDVQRAARGTPQLQHSALLREGPESAAVTPKGFYLHYRIRPQTGNKAPGELSIKGTGSFSTLKERQQKE